MVWERFTRAKRIKPKVSVNLRNNKKPFQFRVNKSAVEKSTILRYAETCDLYFDDETDRVGIVFYENDTGRFRVRNNGWLCIGADSFLNYYGIRKVTGEPRMERLPETAAYALVFEVRTGKGENNDCGEDAKGVRGVSC